MLCKNVCSTAKLTLFLDVLISVLVGICSSISMILRFRNFDSAISISSFTGQILDTVADIGAVPATIVMICCGLLMYKYLQVLRKGNKKSACIIALFAFLLALTVVVPGQWSEGQENNTGFPWYSSGAINWKSGFICCVFLLKWLSVGLLFWAMLGLMYEKCFTSNVSDCSQRDSSIVRCVEYLQFKVKNIVIATIILLCCWIPILIINGPIIIPMDTMVQIIQMRGFPVWDPMMMTPLDGYSLSDHNPFFDSFIYGAFDRLGLLLGNEIVGFIIYTWCQSALGAFSLVLVFTWVVNRTNINRYVVALSAIVVAFVPAWSSYMTVIMKDSTWIPVYTIWCVLFFEYLYRLKEPVHISWSFIALFIGITILAGLTKKTSVYVTAPTLILVAIFMRDKVKSIICAFVPAICVISIIPMIIFPILKIAPGGTQEILGTPMQQITKVLIEHQNELSDEEINAISKVLDIEKAKTDWKPSTVDPVKHSFNQNATVKEIADFLIVWVKCFFRYPDEYFAAVPFIRNAFLIGPTYYTNGTMKCGWGPSGGYAILPEIEDCSYSPTQEYISNNLMNVLSRIPPFSLIGAEGLYVSWIPLLSIMLCVLRRRNDLLVFLLPVFLTWCNLLIIPAPQQRYSIGLLFPALLNIALPFLTYKKRLLIHNQ